MLFGALTERSLSVCHARHGASRDCGADAPVVAAQRADELLDRGDLEGVAVWKNITRAVEDLLRKAPKVGEWVN